jgi:hypothetical protein
MQVQDIPEVSGPLTSSLLPASRTKPAEFDIREAFAEIAQVSSKLYQATTLQFRPKPKVKLSLGQGPPPDAALALDRY